MLDYSNFFIDDIDEFLLFYYYYFAEMSNNITQLGETQYVFYILPKRLLQLFQPSFIEMLDNFAQQINGCPVDRIAVLVATY